MPETGAAIDFLLAELRSDRLTSVIDVGANPLFETPSILWAAVFASQSLVLCCLDELVRRGSVPADLPAGYVDTLPAAFRQG